MNSDSITRFLVNIVLIASIILIIVLTVAAISITRTPEPVPTAAPSPTVTPAPTPYTRNLRSDEETLKTLAQLKSITIAYSRESEPFSYQTEQGSPGGYEIDLFLMLMKAALGYTTSQTDGNVTILSKNQSEQVCPMPVSFSQSENEQFDTCDYLKIYWKDIAVSNRVNAATWVDKFEGGSIALVIGAISETPSRCELRKQAGKTENDRTICTETPHWGNEKLGLLVRAQAEKFTGFCDPRLRDATFVFMEDTEAAQQENPDVFTSKKYSNCTPEIVYGDKVNRPNRERIIQTLLGEDGDENAIAHITDVTIMENYRQKYAQDQLEIAAHSDSTAQYIFLMREDNLGLRELLDDKMESIAPNWQTDVKKKISDLLPTLYIATPTP